MKPVIVGVDDSPSGRAALTWARSYANDIEAPLRAVTAIDLPQIVGRSATLPELNQLDGIRAATKEWLRDLVESELGPQPPTGVDVRVLEGHAVEVLVGESKDAQLLVVGARGAGRYHHVLLGSVSSGVTHHAHCSVVVVRDGEDESDARRSLVVGFDGSLDSRAALDWASGYARSRGAPLTLVAAWEWPSFQGVPIVFGHIDPIREMKEALEIAAAETGLPDDLLRTVVAKGAPAEVLLEHAHHAELLVVGSRGASSFQEWLLGSVSKRCADHAGCSVAIIRRHPA